MIKDIGKNISYSTKMMPYLQADAAIRLRTVGMNIIKQQTIWDLNINFSDIQIKIQTLKQGELL